MAAAMPAAVAASEATKQSSFDAVPVAVTADAKEFDLIPPSANFGTPDRFSVRPSDDAADTTAGLLEHDGISAAVIGKENDDPGKTASSGSILMYSRGPESNGADLVAVSSLTKILDEALDKSQRLCHQASTVYAERRRKRARLEQRADDLIAQCAATKKVSDEHNQIFYQNMMQVLQQYQNQQ